MPSVLDLCWNKRKILESQ